LNKGGREKISGDKERIIHKKGRTSESLRGRRGTKEKSKRPIGGPGVKKKAGAQIVRSKLRN